MALPSAFLFGLFALAVWWSVCLLALCVRLRTCIRRATCSVWRQARLVLVRFGWPATAKWSRLGGVARRSCNVHVRVSVAQTHWRSCAACRVPGFSWPRPPCFRSQRCQSANGSNTRGAANRHCVSLRHRTSLHAMCKHDRSRCCARDGSQLWQQRSKQRRTDAIRMVHAGLNFGPYGH